MMSIVLHHYKMLKVSGLNNSSDDHNNYIYDYISNHSNILKQELDKWYNFSSVLRKRIECHLKKCYNHYTNIHLQSMQKEKKILQSRYL